MKNVVSPLKGSWQILGIEGVSVPYQRLLVFGVTAGLLLAFWLVLTRTRLGWGLRACSQDPEAAALQGMNINVFALVAMAMSAAFAGVSGAIMAPIVVVNPHMGGTIIITAFIVIIVGGMGSTVGAVIAAVLYAFFDTFVTTFYDGVTASILGLAIMLAVLVFRPTGIMGTVERESASEAAAEFVSPVKELPFLWGKGTPLLAVLGLLCALPFLVRPFQLEILIFLFLNIMVVVSYRFIVLTGEWSFGHVVTMGVGAYTSALLTTRLGFSPWLGVPLGGVVAGFIAYLLSFPLFRMKAFFFLIGTFAAAEAIRLCWLRFRKLFGGSDGITGIPSLEIGGLDLGLPMPFYYFALIMMLAILAIFYRLEKSFFGLTLNAIHWRDQLTESVGVHARNYRVVVFVIASFFAGIAGALYAHYLGLVSPHAFGLGPMLNIMVWAIVGGTSTFLGPIIGATLLTFVDEFIRAADEYRPLIYGVILIATMLFLPQGLESLPSKIRTMLTGQMRRTGKRQED
jgi:branched-chain amino acid transport system permease protein